MKKIFAIGDIHGCLEKLKELMDKLVIDNEKDTILFIGDYIDRGNSGKKVVDYVLHLKSEYKNVICLLGNHEQMFMQYLDGLDEGLYLGNGGISNLNSYEILLSDNIAERKRKVPSDHLKFFKFLLPYYETDVYIFAHAGIRPGLPLKDQTLNDILWIRNEFIESKKDFGKLVIFGHTPLITPLIEKNKIGIDTGVVYGGKLTCVELPKLKIYQA